MKRGLWKREKVRLIDDSQLALSRDRSRALVEKPEAQFRSEAHKTWIRTLPCLRCLICGNDGHGPREACHLRIGTDGCGGIEPSDIWCWPGHGTCHRLVQHFKGEKTFWFTMLGIDDPWRYILDNYALRSDCQKARAFAAEEHARMFHA